MIHHIYIFCSLYIYMHIYIHVYYIYTSNIHNIHACHTRPSEILVGDDVSICKGMVMPLWKWGLHIRNGRGLYTHRKESHHRGWASRENCSLRYSEMLHLNFYLRTHIPIIGWNENLQETLTYVWKDYSESFLQVCPDANSLNRWKLLNMPTNFQISAVRQRVRLSTFQLKMKRKRWSLSDGKAQRPQRPYLGRPKAPDITGQIL